MIRISDAIFTLLGDPARRLKLDEAGRARVSQCYALPSVRPAQLANYDRAIAHCSLCPQKT